ncbi:MAG TPA: hypothetical protein VGD06_04920 [Acidobacteriota bacterium]
MRLPPRGDRDRTREAEGPTRQAGGKDSPSTGGSPFAHVELSIPRDRLLHLGVGCALLFLGLDATLAHSVARPAAAGPWMLAWVPLAYGIVAASAAFVLALRRSPGRWAYRLHGLAMAVGWAVGLAGALLHAAAVGREGLGIIALFGAASLAPLALGAVAVVGWIAAWSDEALGVGRAPDAVTRGMAPAVPGRRALLLMAAAGFGALALTTLVDHRAGGWRWTEGIAVVAALASLAVVLAMLPGRGSERLKLAYVGTMMVDVLVGFAGLALHLSANMAGPPEQLMERMVLHAPLTAPLLFGLLGMLGLLAVAEPAVDPEALEAAWPPRRRRNRGAPREIS